MPWVCYFVRDVPMPKKQTEPLCLDCWNKLISWGWRLRTRWPNRTTDILTGSGPQSGELVMYRIWSSHIRKTSFSTHEKTWSIIESEDLVNFDVFSGAGSIYRAFSLSLKTQDHPFQIDKSKCFLTSTLPYVFFLKIQRPGGSGHPSLHPQSSYCSYPMT